MAMLLLTMEALIAYLAESTNVTWTRGEFE